MRAFPAIVVTVTCVSIALAAAASAEQPDPANGYRIIVHPANPLTSVDPRFLEDAFLKKVTRWTSGKVIRPADIGASSAARASFSKEVLNRSVAAVRAYWQQRIFSGADVPPPEFDRNEDVVAYVLQHEGAVGYVSGSANLGVAKTVAVRR